MELKEIINNMDLTNNRTLDEILQIETFLRECIRHHLSLKLMDNDENHPKELWVPLDDCNELFIRNNITEVSQTPGEGFISFELEDYAGHFNSVDFDDMPIEALIAVLRNLKEE